ncbi:hypothetical protein [uncultured Tateyamaria sp.]|uniref:hypothetical protein n=1 Tax=uncultured Tateyamaria sp. TaxID=455651 RepID=UPI00260A90F9|nr:hypothetical protein [uncultured Tateyamaria sp.]
MTGKLPMSLDDVPSSMIDIAEAFGFDVVEQLMANYGGLDVKFPTNPPEDHPVLQLLGDKRGREVCFFLSSANLYIPNSKQLQAQKSGNQHRVEVQRMVAEGMTTDQIALQLGLSVRHVRRLAQAKSAKKPDPNQLFLPFDD